MPKVKYAIANAMRQIVHLPESADWCEVYRAWAANQLAEDVCDAAMVSNPIAARPCGCGPHLATPDGNLFLVVTVSRETLQKVKDSNRLAGDVAEGVQAALAETQHLAADVVLVCREPLDLWHIAVKRSAAYVVRQTTHVVKEAS